MWKGEVVSIQIGPEKGGLLVPHENVAVEEGCGIVGDRHYKKPDAEPGQRQITIISTEALGEAEIDALQSRRDIAVRDVPLNDLLGKCIRLGGVLVEVTKLCEPCMHMEELAGKPGCCEALKGKGGICGMILNSGKIRIGDPVVPETD